MNLLLAGLLSNAVFILPLTGLAALAFWYWQPRPAIRHAVWLVIFIKLLTPPLYHLDLENVWEKCIALTTTPAKVDHSCNGDKASTNAFPLSAQTVPEDSGALTDTETASAELSTHRDSWFAFEQVPISTKQAVVQDSSSLASVVNLPAIVNATEGVSAGPTDWLSVFGVAGMLAWISGSLCFYFLVFYRAYRFQRLLQYAQSADARWQNLAEERARSLGLKRSPIVKTVPGPLVPMIWSFGGPAMLLLPRALLTDLTEKEIDTLLAHELAHVRRGDHWFRMIEILVLGIYWWHPVVWFARQQLREAEEQCCDAWVACTLPHAKACYAQAILRTLDVLAASPRSLPLVGSGLSPFRQLKRRLQMLKQSPSIPVLSGAHRWAFLGLTFILLPLGCSWAEDDAPPGAPPPPPRGAPPRLTDRDDDPPPRAEAPRRRENRGQMTMPAPSPRMDDGPELGKEEAMFEARSELKLLEVRLHGKEIRLRDWMSQLEQANAEWERTKKAHEAGTISRTELNTLRTRVEGLKTQVALGQVELEESKVQIDIARERLQLIEKGVIKLRRMAPPQMMGGMMGQTGPGGPVFGFMGGGQAGGSAPFRGPDGSFDPRNEDPRRSLPRRGDGPPRPDKADEPPIPGGPDAPRGRGHAPEPGQAPPGRPPFGAGGAFPPGPDAGRGQPRNLDELNKRINDLESQLRELIKMREQMQKDRGNPNRPDRPNRPEDDQ